MTEISDNTNFVFDLPKNRSASIKVIGVGGGGSNAVNYMYEQGITGVDFIICNTDAQALNNSPIPNKIQLGLAITEGLGAGANPEVGEQAALESLDDIKSILDSNTKMVFITAGMGGGTGTGAAPIIAGIAKEMGILTVAIVTVPFQFEGKMRIEQAEKGLEKLRNAVDSLIIINNNKLRELYGNLGYKTGFAKADEVLATAAKGIAEVITHHYTQNIDLRDARTVLANSGTAIMGSAKASGENKAKEAIMQALDSPLLNDNKITGARNVLLLILSGEEEITMDEIGLINDFIQQEAGHQANIIMGVGEDESLGENISVTIVATGFPVDDQRFTGKAEKKIFHTLSEEQPLTQRFDIEKTSFKQENSGAITRYVLEDTTEEKEPKKTTTEELEEDFSFDLKIKEEIEITAKTKDTVIETESNSQHSFFFDDPKEEKTHREVTGLETTKEVQVETFHLEDYEETAIEANETLPLSNESLTESNTIEKTATTSILQEEVALAPSKPIIEDTDPFDVPLLNSSHSKLDERRAKLKKFNFTFNNTIKEQDFENIPAYKRQGVEFNQGFSNKGEGGIYLSNDENNDLQIRPNNFLHDNVD